MAGGNSPFSSGSSISSLLRIGITTQNKIQEYNDAVIDNQWANSAKTYEDFVAYSGYLEKQQKNTTDPMKKLGYTRNINSARSAYISNTIQRASINVIEGGQSNRDKYSQMLQLYYKAADSGQYDLAQSLHLQLDNLSVTIQNEDQALASAGRAAGSANDKAIKAQIQDSIGTVNSNANYAIEQYGKMGKDAFEKATGSDLFTMLGNMINSNDPNNPGIAQLYQQGIENSSNPTDIQRFQKKLTMLDGEKLFTLPGVGKIGLGDIKEQAYAASIGQTLFQAVQTANGVEFKKENKTGYEWGRDETGGYKLMPIYNNKTDFTSAVPGKNGNQNYADLLKNTGFNVTSEGGSLVVTNNGEFNSAGIPQGEQVQLYVDASGNLQFINGDKAYNVNFDPGSGKYLGVAANTPNPITPLPSGNQLYSKFSNRFTSTLDPNTINAGSIGVIDTTSKYAKEVAPGTISTRGSINSLKKTPVKSVQSPGKRAVVQPKPINVQRQSHVNVMSAPKRTKISLPKPKKLPNIKVNTHVDNRKVTVNNHPNNQTVTVNTSMSNGLW